MSHPLLIKVLRDVYWEEEAEAPRAPSEMVYAMPDDVADRLEFALNVCLKCGGREKYLRHRELTFDFYHPYQPLVNLD